MDNIILIGSIQEFMLIKRNGKSLTQLGSLLIQAGERLLILAENNDALEEVKGKIGI